MNVKLRIVDDRQEDNRFNRMLLAFAIEVEPDDA